MFNVVTTWAHFVTSNSTVQCEKRINLCKACNKSTDGSYVGCWERRETIRMKWKWIWRTQLTCRIQSEKSAWDIFCIGMAFHLNEVAYVQSNGVCVWMLSSIHHTCVDVGLFKWREEEKGREKSRQISVRHMRLIYAYEICCGHRQTHVSHKLFLFSFFTTCTWNVTHTITERGESQEWTK